jgi:RNA polymerase sigma factor (sigma-70 family)
METPPTNEETGDRALVRDIIRRADGAWEEFVRHYSPLINSLCSLVFPADTAADEYLRILARFRADDFAVLKKFREGRGRLSTYLTFKIRDLLASRLVDLFRQDPERAWGAFESFYKNDIRRIIAEHFPLFAKQDASDDGRTREDLYQEICLLLIENCYSRIMKYRGRGSFTGYIHVIVNNLCTDLFIKMVGKRRVPETIRRLCDLDQDVFKRLYWGGYTLREVMTRFQDQYSVAQVEQAAGRVEQALLRSKYKGRPKTQIVPIQPDLPEQGSSIEDILIVIQEKIEQERAFKRLEEAIAELPHAEQLFVRLRSHNTSPKSPQEIARIMGRTVDEMYKLRQKSMARLRAALKTQESSKIS